jgi:hypothetical protein
MTSGIYPRPAKPPCACGKPRLAGGKCTGCYTRARRARRSPGQVQLDRRRAADLKKLWYAGLAPEKKRAHIRYNALRRYGLTQAGFDGLLAKQGGVCALCHLPPAAGEVLRVDHNHRCCAARPFCGRCVRGLLHHRCNTWLAAIEEPEFLAAATAYLKKYP